MAECIFCKIVAGGLPSEKVAEGDDWVAILDIQPVSPGHTLVVARKHVESLPDATEDLLARLMAAVRRLAPAVMRATNSPGFNLHQNNDRCAGQLIPHLHFHIIPRRPDDGIRFGWRQKPYPEGEIAKVGDAVRKALTG